MATVTMPTGEQVDMPDNPTADQLASLQQISTHQKWLSGEQQSDTAMLQSLPQESTLGKIGTQLGIGLEKGWEGAKQAISGSPLSNALGLQARTPQEMQQKQQVWNQAAKMGGGGGLTQGIGQAAPWVAGAVAAPEVELPALGVAGTGALMGAGWGAAQGATEPTTQPGQRQSNVLWGAGLGGGLGGAMPAVTKAVSNAISPIRAAGAAALNAVQKTGADIGDTISALRSAPETTVTGTAPTAGQATGNAGLIGLEKSSRLDPKQAVGWDAADAANNTARMDNLKTIVGDPVDEEARATLARTNATQVAKQQVTNTIDQTSSGLAAPLNLDLANGLKGIAAQAGNKEGQQVLSDINSKLMSGKIITAQDAIGMREALGAAGTSDPAIGQAKQAIDTVLNQRSGNAWGQYNDQFTKLSAPVDEAKALQGIMKTHLDPNNPDNVLSSTLNPDKLAEALRVHGAPNDYGTPTIPPETAQHITDLIGETRAANAWQGSSVVPPPKPGMIAQAAQAAGGGVGGAFLGSMTGLGGPLGAAAGVGTTLVAQGVKSAIKSAQGKALANALRDPAALADAMEQAQSTPAGTTALSSALRSGAQTMFQPKQR